MSYLSTYQRCEEHMIESVIRAERERVARIAELEPRGFTLAERVALVETAAENAVPDRQTALGVLALVEVHMTSFTRLSQATVAGLKRYLTIREYARLVTAQ